MIVHREVVPPFGENSWLVGSRRSGRAVLVDPGGHIAELLQRAQDEHLQVEQIWLTHAHLDHVTGVAEAVRATAAPVFLHPADRPLYDALKQQGAMFGLQVSTPPPPDRSLEANATLQVGQLQARVLHVPGHSPGHVAFWFATQRALFSGDVLFAGSVGRTDLPGGSWPQLQESILQVLLPLGDDVRVLPGHGPDTTIGQERRSNPFLRGNVPL